MPKLDLTDRFCAGARPRNGEQRTSYFDGRTPGLELLVAHTGHKSWHFHFMSPRDGKRARHKLGSYPTMPLAKARREAIAARQQVEDGHDPRMAARGVADMTFAALVERYFADPNKARLRSISEIRRRLEKDALPILGDIKLGALARRDVRDAIERVQARGARRQAFLVFKDVQAVLRWAVRNEYIDRNVTDGMDRPAAGVPKERVLSDDEIRTLWQALPETFSRSIQCQRIVRLCLGTGQRLGEVAGMTRAELDLPRRMWSLPGSRTKNAHPHHVPLSDLALAIIGVAMAAADAEAGAGALFVGEDGGPLEPHVVTRAITRARATGRSPIAPWSAHDLRRTALTGMARLGVPPHVIAHVANHRSVTKGSVTTAHYLAYSYEAEKRRALDMWAEHLAAIVGGRTGRVVHT